MEQEYKYRDSLSFRVTRIMLVITGITAILLTLVPWYAGHLENKALIEAEQGYQVESLHEAEKAVTYNPFSINALFVLAGAQQRIGRENQARLTLLKATELQPMNYITWEQLALYERDKWGQPDLAREHFEKAVALNPQDRYLKIRAGIPVDKLP